MPALTSLILLFALSAPLTIVQGQTNYIPGDQSIDLTVSAWSVPGCPGKPNALHVVDDSSNTILGHTYSYQLSRNMETDEIMEFSGYASDGEAHHGFPVQCSQFVERVNPDSNGNMLVGSKCYEFLGGATAACVNVTATDGTPWG